MSSFRPIPKILVCGQEELFDSALELLLQTQDGWQVYRFPAANACQTLQEQIAQIHPDVILVCLQANTPRHDFPWEALNGDARVVFTNLENNSLEVFRRQQVRVKRLTDLFSALHVSCI